MSSFHDDDEQDFLFAMQLVTATALPMTMKAAIELGLLEIMAKASPSHQLSSSEITSHLPSKNHDSPLIVDRILRLLATHSILTCKLVNDKDGHSQRLYGLAPVCRYFLPNEDGVSLAPYMLLCQDKVSVDSWYHLKGALDGELPFMKAHNGMQGFEYATQDTRINNLFNQSMYNHTALVMKKILEIYNGFQGLNELMDVGGGFGSNLKLIVSKYPQIKAINFDLPYVIKDATPSPGVEHVGGDMFVNVPKAEAIFMKWILHDWGDDKCLKLLKNCYDAVPDSGKVIIVESIMPEFPETDVVTQNITRSDLGMLNTIPGAKERTKEEFQALATTAGFAAMEEVCRAYCYSVIELYKIKSPI